MKKNRLVRDEKKDYKNFFCNLCFSFLIKKATRTINFHSNEHSHDILGPTGRYDHPWEKKQTNKYASVIFLLAKNTKFHIFADRSFKSLQ
jgi:hypothetical protein